MADFTVSINDTVWLSRIEAVVGTTARDPNFTRNLARLIYKAVADIEFMNYAQAEGQSHDVNVKAQYDAMQQRIRDKRTQLDGEINTNAAASNPKPGGTNDAGE